MAADRKDLAELEALEAELARRSRWTEWCPQRPHPKQSTFLGLDCLEALFGGAAGPGKSSALLMAALEHVDKQGYSALILRRTFADLSLPGAIMDRSHEWLRGTRATWNGLDKRWTFPSGASLTFGYLDTEKDRYRYQSAEFQFIGFDEATQFPENWYRYLLSRLRRVAGSNVPLRARLGSNPGGIGHAWVHRRFVESTSPERRFVPAVLTDNPHLDVDEYRKSLAQLDETTRRQLEDGVWVQDSSGLVYRPATCVAVLPEGEWTYMLGIDFGIRDSCAYVVGGWRKHDRTFYVVESMKENDKTVTESAERVKEYQTRYKFSRIVGDLGGMGAAFGVEFQRRHGIPIEAAEKVGKLGYIALMNGAIERSEVAILERTNRALLKEWAELPWADETRQKESAGFDNHLADASLYLWRAAWAFLQHPLDEKPKTVEDVIRADTAAIWARHDAEQHRNRDQDYDVGHKLFASEDDYA